MNNKDHDILEYSYVVANEIIKEYKDIFKPKFIRYLREVIALELREAYYECLNNE